MRSYCIAIITLVSVLKQSFGYSPTPSSRLLYRQTQLTFPPSLHTSPRTTTASSRLFNSAASNDGENSSRLDKTNNEKKNIFSRLKRLLVPESAEKMSTKELFAKMGMSAMLSYGFVSNMSYCVAVSIAYFAFTTKTGLSPLAPGQWKGFLAVYAGFYVFNNVIRPIRMAVSIGLSKYFEMSIEAVQKRTKWSRGASTGIIVFLVNFCGTLAMMSLGVFIASLFSGVPVFPPKVVQ